MKHTLHEPPVPAERQETIRQEIILLLLDNPLSAKEISPVVSVSEKEVYFHLAHIQKTLHRKGQRLEVTPPECSKCGFVFAKRQRLTKPGKCPVCKGEKIQEPLFSIHEMD